MGFCLICRCSASPVCIVCNSVCIRFPYCIECYTCIICIACSRCIHNASACTCRPALESITRSRRFCCTKCQIYSVGFCLVCRCSASSVCIICNSVCIRFPYCIECHTCIICITCSRCIHNASACTCRPALESITRSRRFCCTECQIYPVSFCLVCRCTASAIGIICNSVIYRIPLCIKRLVC